MIERLTDLPSGILGFRASGKITNDEHRSSWQRMARHRHGLGAPRRKRLRLARARGLRLFSLGERDAARAWIAEPA